MTDKKSRIVSNLLSLVLGAGIGDGSYGGVEQIRQGTQKIEMEAPPELDGGGELLARAKARECS